ncbi:MAG: major capsid protein [Ruminococcus sp.]|nr:major capsid protein [Ruminococcus sp.]
MILHEVFTAEAIASNYTEVASNKIPYLGAGLFPAKKKQGLDLKWIKGNKGLAVSLAPSTFDSKSTFRDRIGIKFSETEMPFFRESMLVKEADEQEIMRVQDSNDPYAQQVLDHIFDDTRTLVEGAEVVPERMRMQLLAPMGGKVGISVIANNVNYTFNYDPDGSWKEKHYLKIESATDKWSAAETCDPLKDLEDAIDMQDTATGTKPAYALMTKKTFKYIKNSKKVQSAILAQNVTANVNYTTKKVKAFVEEELDIKIVIYTKKFKDESGKERQFYADDGVMLFPEGALGDTWFGTTPEERKLMGSKTADVSIVNTGVAITVTETTDPVNTKVTASEIVLPSFERMDECYFIEVA